MRRNKGINVAATGITQLLILKPPVAQKKRNESNETKTRRLGREESWMAPRSCKEDSSAPGRPLGVSKDEKDDDIDVDATMPIDKEVNGMKNGHRGRIKD